MTIIKLLAMDQALSFDVEPKLAAGDQNSVQLHVEFSTEWLGYSKSAAFYTSLDSTVYEVVLNDGKCVVPHEVLEKPCQLYIGIRGVNANNNAVKTSCLIKCKIVEGAPVGDAVPSEPTPDVYQQILTAYGQVEGSVTKHKQDNQNPHKVTMAQLGVDKALAKKMDAGVMYYYHPEETTEDGLNNWLENTVLPSMPDNSCKNVWIRCKAVDDLDTMGVVYKRTKDWAVVDLVSHVNGHHLTKCRNEDWRNQGKDVWGKTVCNDSVFTMGEMQATEAYFPNTRLCKFFIVNVVVDTSQISFAVDAHTLKDGEKRYFSYDFPQEWYNITERNIRISRCTLTVKKREANKDVAFTLTSASNDVVFMTRIVGYC